MRKILLLLILASAASGAVFAQGVTTATISGEVIDASGAGLPGANVIALHVPSGTTYGNSTRADGRYTLPGLRIGGPYKITVTFVGYQDYVLEGLNLSLGQNFVLNPTLVETGTELQEITVTTPLILLNWVTLTQATTVTFMSPATPMLIQAMEPQPISLFTTLTTV